MLAAREPRGARATIVLPLRSVPSSGQSVGDVVAA